jgi:type I restriction enzyme R subunit
LTEAETETIIGRLENIPSAPLYQGNREAFPLVNEGFDLTSETRPLRNGVSRGGGDPGKLALHIDYIKET